MKKFAFIFLISLSVQAAAQQQDSAFIRALATEILTNGKAWDQLRILTKEIGGRLAGSPQMYQAEAWGVKTFKSVNADTVWLQQCMVPHWVRGGKDRAEVQMGKTKRKLDVIALGNSQGSMKPVTAPILLVNNFEELEQRKAEIKGKIVVFNYAFNPAHVSTFLSYRDAGRYRGQGPSRASRYGAVGVIIRSMSHSTDNFPHTGSTSYNDSFPKIPALAMGLRDADALAEQWKKTEKINATIQTFGKFLPDTPGHNVIAELKGSDPDAGIITVGGHLDSWDNCEGAHDDGAGCVQTIEVLRAFKALGYKPKHTIRFVLFANEENGLRGGNKYAEEAKRKGEKHVFALESDAGGFTPRGFGFTMTAEQFEKVKKWEALLAPYGAGSLTIGGGGADIGPLNRQLGTPLAGLQPDSQRYFDYHHARNDVFEAVNKRELLLGAVNMAALIYLVDRNF